MHKLEKRASSEQKKHSEKTALPQGECSLGARLGKQGLAGSQLPCVPLRWVSFAGSRLHIDSLWLCLVVWGLVAARALLTGPSSHLLVVSAHALEGHPQALSPWGTGWSKVCPTKPIICLGNLLSSLLWVCCRGDEERRARVSLVATVRTKMYKEGLTPRGG